MYFGHKRVSKKYYVVKVESYALVWIKGGTETQNHAHGEFLYSM